MRSVVTVVAALLALWPAGSALAAQQPTATGQAQPALGTGVVKIPADTSNEGSFGIAVDVTANGSTAIVGAQQHNFDRGGAYIFQRASGSWQETADLTLPGLGYQASYGNAVAISADGSLAMVSEVGWQQLTGMVFIFAKTATGWKPVGQLVAPDRASYTHFGDSISLDAAGNRVVIGALGADGFSGRAYVFSRGSSPGQWSLTAELAPPASQGQTDFGTSVSMDTDGSVVLIGGNVYGNGTGAAYVFGDTGGGWQQQAMLMASNPQAGADFGTSVAIDGAGTTAVVGAVYEDDDAGAAYVYQAGSGGWAQTARLAQQNTGQFGNAVAINQAGGTAVVGAEATQTPGRAYVYSNGTAGWATTMTLAPNVTSQALFGVATTMDRSGDEAVVGAAWDNNNNPSASGFGAVYIEPVQPNPPCGSQAC
jgi:hypothetical protein